MVDLELVCTTTVLMISALCVLSVFAAVVAAFERRERDRSDTREMFLRAYRGTFDSDKRIAEHNARCKSAEERKS